MSGSVEVNTAVEIVENLPIPGQDKERHINGSGGTETRVVSNGSVPSKTTDAVAVEGFNGVKTEDSTAYLNNYKAHKTGISHGEMVDAYTEWAPVYDKDLCPGRYNGPEIAAKAIGEYYQDQEIRTNLRILDVAAGTGRVGEELVKLGFRNLDALEPSEGMLVQLKEKTDKGKSIYTVSYQCAVGVGLSGDVPSDIYDCLVIAGGMGEGHIPVKALDEMVRMVRPGGTVFIIMREEYLTYVKEYVNRLEPYMDNLEQQGLWKRIARQVVPHYSFNKNGIVFSYQVLSKSE